MQRCKSAGGRCKSAKVRCEGSGTRTEGRGVALPRLHRVGSGLRTDLGFLKRGTGDREGSVGEGRPALRDSPWAKRLSERGQAPSRERDEARPQQARLGWYAVPTLPEA